MVSTQEKLELALAVKFKIHALTSVNGAGRSTNDNVFYGTYQKAHDKAIEYLAENPTCEGFVIMSTCAILKRAPGPVSTYLVHETGSIEKVT